MMDDVLDSVVASLSDSSGLLSSSGFLKRAASEGLFDFNLVVSSPCTVFVPLDDGDVDETPCFAALWNRHVVPGRVRAAGDGVQQITTAANIVYALYRDDSIHDDGAGYSIASLPLRTFWNVEHNGMTFHAFEGRGLPDLLPIPNETHKLAVAYVAHQLLEITFGACGLVGEGVGYTLVVSMTKANRTPICKNLRTQWVGNGTICRLTMPEVRSVEHQVMIWFSIVDNERKFPVLSTAFPWFVSIFPNERMHLNPVVCDILPKKGKADEELWILGREFQPAHVRVWVDKQLATIFFCDDRLIRCFVPPGTGVCGVCVANGNVYTTFDSFTYV